MPQMLISEIHSCPCPEDAQADWEFQCKSIQPDQSTLLMLDMDPMKINFFFEQIFFDRGADCVNVPPLFTSASQKCRDLSHLVR